MDVVDVVAHAVAVAINTATVTTIVIIIATITVIVITTAVDAVVVVVVDVVGAVAVTRIVYSKNKTKSFFPISFICNLLLLLDILLELFIGEL